MTVSGASTDSHNRSENHDACSEFHLGWYVLIDTDGTVELNFCYRLAIGLVQAKSIR